MRRKDREITDVNEILEVINSCKVCRLAMADNNRPYIVPLNFGYTFEGDRMVLYFHSAKTGEKIDIMKKNGTVCFEMDGDHTLIEGPHACDYGFAYRSVIGFGTVSFIEDDKEKTFALNTIMKHQTDDSREYTYGENHLRNVCVYKVICSSFTGKQKRFFI
ncbi:pyridoxamine 5'-phosphate oxidase family protein [Breznakiella homolactica]|uniref:Pyridoxamine 5'-phosphate oxidase family protein n=1 Tax=Breznakiella homolactica TaxID=2798577 RepID=A0A7T8BC82_9SPIR|nr:pyridoxamine 5'-phosphate oxidase family protein [Breznakiella homolactica]QQO09963.1 pyridoxamine 5'-phosphate oxidase family protein [Breznakiella homolactica]